MGDECFEWLGNEFYDVLTMKIQFNWNIILQYHLWRQNNLARPARKSADNSTCLQSKCFKINTGKSQGNESVLVAQLIQTFYSLEYENTSAKHIAQDTVTSSEILSMRH